MIASSIGLLTSTASPTQERPALVAIAPRIGAYVVAAWLAGIIVDLLLLGGHGDIALRDFGLLVAALALAQLAPAFSRKRA